MKNRYFVLLFLLFSIEAQSQTNDYPLNGNPKIYNYSPGIILQRNTDEGGFTQGIQTRFSNGTDNWFFGALHADNFIVAKGNYQNPLFSVSANGNLQWGNPDSYTRSGQDGQGAWLEQKGSSVANSKIRIQTSTYGDMSNYAQFFMNPEKGFSFQTTGNANGNVGIGTSTPRSPLDVAVYANDEKLSTVLGRLEQGDTNGEGTFLGVRGYGTQFTYGKKSFAIEHAFYGTINSSINFYRGNSIVGGEISFNTNTNLERMRIDAAGNVGIGIATPQEKLSVNGNIRAKEIKVETTNWPDYVFETDYKKLSLAELEKYIRLNKRLPDVPSADEAEKNGIELGEMNKVLLKKIEELTLHLIEKDKSIAASEVEIGTQKEKLSTLEQKYDSLFKQVAQLLNKTKHE